MRTAPMQADSRKSLQDCLAERGLKTSRQREVIAGVFFATGGHPTVEELFAEVRQVDSRIGRTTVYRTLRLMTSCGLAQSRRFLDGEMRYERSDDRRHHDHLVCERCGGIVEFRDSRLEAFQSQVAKDHGFLITEYRMDCYGLCARCRRPRRHAARSPSGHNAATPDAVAAGRFEQTRSGGQPLLSANGLPRSRWAR